MDFLNILTTLASLTALYLAHQLSRITDAIHTLLPFFLCPELGLTSETVSRTLASMFSDEECAWLDKAATQDLIGYWPAFYASETAKLARANKSLRRAERRDKCVAKYAERERRASIRVNYYVLLIALRVMVDMAEQMYGQLPFPLPTQDHLPTNVSRPVVPNLVILVRFVADMELHRLVVHFLWVNGFEQMGALLGMWLFGYCYYYARAHGQRIERVRMALRDLDAKLRVQRWYEVDVQALANSTRAPLSRRVSSWPSPSSVETMSPSRNPPEPQKKGRKIRRG